MLLDPSSGWRLAPLDAGLVLEAMMLGEESPEDKKSGGRTSWTRGVLTEEFESRMISGRFVLGELVGEILFLISLALGLGVISFDSSLHLARGTSLLASESLFSFVLSPLIRSR